MFINIDSMDRRITTTLWLSNQYVYMQNTHAYMRSRIYFSSSFIKKPILVKFMGYIYIYLINISNEFQLKMSVFIKNILLCHLRVVHQIVNKYFRVYLQIFVFLIYIKIAPAQKTVINSKEKEHILRFIQW